MWQLLMYEGAVDCLCMDAGHCEQVSSPGSNPSRGCQAVQSDTLQALQWQGLWEPPDDLLCSQ